MKTIKINGIIFGGFGGSIRYKNSDAPLLTDEESIEKAKLLEPVTVFLTHDGPKRETNDFAHSGLLGITEYIREKNPRYHFFGHRHSPQQILHENQTESICEYRLAIYHFSANGSNKIWSSLDCFL